MSLSPSRMQRFLRLSVQDLIGATLTTALGVVIPVVYPGPFGLTDPDSAANDDSNAIDRIEISWAGSGAGKRGATFMQADIYKMMGSDGQQDPYGFGAEDMLDAVASVFSGLKAGGVQKGHIDLFDYTVPATPVALNECMLCQNSSGYLGEMESSVELNNMGVGVRHLVGRWRFRTRLDASGPAAFYTG